jgi:hypothetical protein
MLGAGSMVPYIVCWTSELDFPADVIQRPAGGIAYADEKLADRDRDGVLWTRISFSPGRGRPEYTRLHPLRQRRAMWRLLCQVCARPAERTAQGHLWLLTDRWRDDWADWPERASNPFPPVCLACARLSVRLCPPLRRGYIAVRAQSRPHGVIGVRFHAPYRFGPPEVVVDNGDAIAYTDPAIRWVQATQLTRTLYDCTFLDLDEVTA